MHPDLIGIEFDWFAADNDGNFALFATAGEGFFPCSVAKHHPEHSSVSDSQNAPRWGTPEVWQDYADLGLFVFDWRLPGGPYEKRESPSGVVEHALKAKIMAVPELPKFDGVFSAHEKIEGWS